MSNLHQWLGSQVVVSRSSVPYLKTGEQLPWHVTLVEAAIFVKSYRAARTGNMIRTPVSGRLPSESLGLRALAGLYAHST
jgi:hypothetical protein